MPTSLYQQRRRRRRERNRSALNRIERVSFLSSLFLKKIVSKSLGKVWAKLSTPDLRDPHWSIKKPKRKDRDGERKKDTERRQAEKKRERDSKHLREFRFTKLCRLCLKVTIALGWLGHILYFKISWTLIVPPNRAPSSGHWSILLHSSCNGTSSLGVVSLRFFGCYAFLLSRQKGAWS